MKEKEVERLNHLKEYELSLYSDNIKYICGIDEAGRGPLAGPVVVGCVIMPKESLIEGINDSKKISEKKREKLYDLIVQFFSVKKPAKITLFLEYPNVFL